MIITIINKEDMEQLRDAVPDEQIDESSICVCALEGEDLMGVLLAKEVTNDHTYDIGYIYVEESVRRRGVARAMLKLLYVTLSSAGASAVTMSYVGEDRDDELSAFLKSEGFLSVRENQILETTLSATCIVMSEKADEK